MNDTEALRSRIAEAFADADRPKEIVSEAAVAHDRWSADIEAAFRERTWQSLTKEFVFDHCDDLAALTAEAFRYFLPAYALHFLRTPFDVNTAGESLLSQLCPKVKTSQEGVGAGGVSMSEATTLASMGIDPQRVREIEKFVRAHENTGGAIGGFEECMNGFNIRQCAAIIAFLEYVDETGVLEGVNRRRRPKKTRAAKALDWWRQRLEQISASGAESR